MLGLMNNAAPKVLFRIDMRMSVCVHVRASRIRMDNEEKGEFLSPTHRGNERSPPTSLSVSSSPENGG